MALINGDNQSGKMFDVVDEDGDVLGSFDDIGCAIDYGRTAPWWAGSVNIRRDRSLNAARHVSTCPASRSADNGKAGHE